MKIAILSDVHANMPALEAVIHDLERNECKYVFVLGDLIGYYYWPKEVVIYFMSHPNCNVIRGNHEDLLIRSLKDENFADKCYQKYGSGLM
jgi:predicted phosphodiesterase